MIVGALLLGGCASSGASGSATAPARIDATRLLSAEDAGPGWTAANESSTDQQCSSPPDVTSMVGSDGTGVRLLGPGGSAELVEYATVTDSVAAAYVAAIKRLEFGTSCSKSSAGHPTTAEFDQVLPLPSYGDHSVAMLLTYDTDGTLTHAGYVVVRHGDDLTVVGYVDPGPLDTAALQEYTTAALTKLQG
jgi:hypothetical protein